MEQKTDIPCSADINRYVIMQYAHNVYNMYSGQILIEPFVDRPVYIAYRYGVFALQPGYKIYKHNDPVCGKSDKLFLAHCYRSPAYILGCSEIP